MAPENKNTFFGEKLRMAIKSTEMSQVKYAIPEVEQTIKVEPSANSVLLNGIGYSSCQENLQKCPTCGRSDK